MRRWIFLCLLTVALSVAAFPSPVVAQQRKAPEQVDTDAMTVQTQFSAPCDAGHMNLVWVIPVEFWRAVFAQDPTMTAQQRAEVIAALEKFVILSVVQADISELGAFDYYPQQEVANSATLTFTDPAGKSRELKLATTIPQDAQALLGVIKPILTAAMGNMGQNFHFLVIDDDDGAGGRAWDPYAFGELVVDLKTRDDQSLRARLEGPVDALFVPRKCPNGRDAHVSWKFCPWTGQELK